MFRRQAARLLYRIIGVRRDAFLALDSGHFRAAEVKQASTIRAKSGSAHAAPQTTGKAMTNVSPRRRLAIVLAAGEGVRMKSDRPKVLHEIAGKSMLAHALAAATAAGAHDLAVVIGPDRDDAAAEALKAAPEASVFVQAQRLGTAHAVLAARASLP